MPPAGRLTVLADPWSVTALWSVPLSRQASIVLVIRVICGHAPSCGFFPYVQVYSVRTFNRLSSATPYVWRSRSALSGSFFPVYLLCVLLAPSMICGVCLCVHALYANGRTWWWWAKPVSSRSWSNLPLRRCVWFWPDAFVPPPLTCWRFWKRWMSYALVNKYKLIIHQTVVCKDLHVICFSNLILFAKPSHQYAKAYALKLDG